MSGHWSLRVTGSCLDMVIVIGVTGSCLDIGSYWKFSGQVEVSGQWLLEIFWSWSLFGNRELLEVLGVTESCLVIGSYWKLSGHWELLEVVWSLELLEVVWSWRVTGSYLGHRELLEVFL